MGVSKAALPLLKRILTVEFYTSVQHGITRCLYSMCWESILNVCSDVKEVVCLLFSLGREGVKECGISDIGAKLDEPGILA